MSSSDDKPQSSRQNSVPEVSESEQKSNPDRDDDQSSKEPKKDEEATVSSRESEKHIPEDSSDGFRTPTSSDHRIPAITQCPPAPKKPRPQPSGLKRKASPPPGAARRLHFDASTAEVESIFRPIDDQDDSTQDHKTKKARTDDEDKS